MRLLERLCNASGVSGDEGEVRKIVLEEIRPYADEVKVDAMGNVLAVRYARAASDSPLRVMVDLLLVVEGPELQRAEEFAAGLGLANRVRSLGQRSDIEHILPCADLFLLPSQSESFGLAALEAMACGVPPLASRVGGLPEVVEDGVSGILAPVGAVDEMAARAIALLQDPKAHAAMAKAARDRAVDRFDRSLWVGEYESVYRELLAVP